MRWSERQARGPMGLTSLGTDSLIKYIHIKKKHGVDKDDTGY